MMSAEEERATLEEHFSVRCPLCGYPITEGEMVYCNPCPLSFSCRFVICPRCFYKFPRP